MLIQSERRKKLAWILGITLAPLLLFAQKPFHIDDSAFLEIAQNILEHPLDPFHGSVALVDYDYQIFKRLGKAPNTFESMSHPPLVPYLMAAVITLRGRIDEFTLHLAFLIFPVMAALSAFYISERFCERPLIAVLVLVTTPIFMVNAQNLMTDVPAMALSLCSVAVFIYSAEHEQTAYALLAGALGGLAALARYPGLISPLLLIIYSIITQKGLRLSIFAAVVSAAVFGIWLIDNFAIYSTAHIWASYKFYKYFYDYLGFGVKHTLIKVVSDFSAIGGCAFLGAIALFYFKKKNRFVVFAIALVIAALLIFLLKKYTLALADYSNLQIVALFCFLSAGIYFVAETIGVVIQNAGTPEMKFLAVWLFLTLVPALFLLPFGTGRYMLPALFPMILILIADLDRVLSKGRKLISAVIVITFVFGLMLSWTDFELALGYKVFPDSFRKNYPKDKLWFIGEWGFRYYMKQQGGVYLLSDDTAPASGGIIVKPQMAGMHQMAESISQDCLVSEPFEILSPNPFRVLNFTAKAGFYSSGYGLLPFGLSQAPIESFDVCLIFDSRSGKSPISKDLQGTIH
jgi:Dolichyl-phosphate-mannose-protein mannosyltransferase